MIISNSHIIIKVLRVARCCFLPLPGGRPLGRFSEEVPDPGVELAVADMGESIKETDPSGPYFLGLPLFFFTGSPEEGTPLPPSGEEPVLMP